MTNWRAFICRFGQYKKMSLCTHSYNGSIIRVNNSLIDARLTSTRTSFLQKFQSKAFAAAPIDHCIIGLSP